MKDTVSRSRWTKRWGVALVVALTGSAMATTTTHAAKSKYGGEVTVAIGDTFPGFCVSNIPNHSALGGFRLIYEQLFERTPAGEYVGSLAESGVPNATLDQWTVKIRPGIKFSNGEALNADAVKLNVDLNAGLYNAQNPSTAAAEFATAGKGYASTGIGVNANIINVAKIDDLTVRFDLDHPQNDFLGILYRAGRYVMRAPSQLWDPVTKKPNIAPYQTDSTKTCGNYPIGTGPFKFVSFTTDTLVVEKNADYWRKNPLNGDKLPYLDKITFVNVKEPSQRAAAVRKGTYDAAMFSSASEAKFIKDLRLRKSLVTEFKSKTEFYPSPWLNQGKTGSVFASKNARLAVLHCMDRVNFVKVRTGGEATVAKSLVGPTSIMYTTRGFQKFSVAKSKEYVAAWQAEAGNAGKTLEFTFPSDVATASQANAKFYQTQWEKCGIKANITVEESAQIIAKTLNSSKTGAAQNAYDAIFILLLEGTDVSFNMPFLLSNAIETGSQAATWSSEVGTVLSLNHPTAAAAKTSDDALKAGEAATTPAVAKLKYQEAIAFLQTEGFMGSSAHFYYDFFANNKSGIAKSIGKLQLVKGKTQRIVTNWGIDWTGVHK